MNTEKFNSALKLLFIIAFFELVVVSCNNENPISYNQSRVIENSENSNTFSSILDSTLQSKLDELRSEYKIKGISASAYDPNKGMWQGVSGVSYGTTPITFEMKFGIASNTKLFTSVALLKLEENNILSLDDSIYHWLLPMDNISPNIKIKQLLNHTSGIRDFTEVNGYVDSIMTNPKRIFTPSEIIRWINKPIFQVGTNSSYSSSNYVLAGMIFESASNQQLELFIHDSILAPHSLKNTFFPTYEIVKGKVAHPWENGVDKNRTSRNSLLSSYWSAGAMYSTSEDMNNWYRYLFANQILSANSIVKMTTSEDGFGLGIIKLDLQGRKVYGHPGNIKGYRSMMLYDEQTKSIVCVLINQNSAPVELIAEEILLALIN